MQTFSETFSSCNSEENMSSYLGSAFSAEKLSKELSDPGSAFYFAESQGREMAYLKVNIGGAQTEMNEQNALEIERLYVLKEHIGKGIGQLLCDKALDLALEGRKDYVWLGVWEHNERALRFYRRNGFVIFDQHSFILGDDHQTDLMMKRDLDPDHGSMLSSGLRVKL